MKSCGYKASSVSLGPMGDGKKKNGLKVLQTKIIGNEIGFCTHFGAKPSFIPNLSIFLSASTTTTFSLLLHVLLP